MADPYKGTSGKEYTAMQALNKIVDLIETEGLGGPKAGSLLPGAFTGNPKKATVTFATALPTTDYSISIIGEDSRSWTIESKTPASFVINSGSNIALVGNTDWIVANHNDS